MLRQVIVRCNNTRMFVHQTRDVDTMMVIHILQSLEVFVVTQPLNEITQFLPIYIYILESNLSLGLSFVIPYYWVF